MKKDKTYSLLFLIGFLFLLINCSGDDNHPEPEIPANTSIEIKLGTTNGAAYKVFYQNSNQINSRKGIIILAVGDGGNENDATLNTQCNALAQKGYVALTTTYRPFSTNYTDWMVSFKEDIEKIIGQETLAFSITRNKVVIGGLSRGGNLTFGLVTPGQMGTVPPIAGIKGVILECAGGDWWKGSAILFPTLLMSNATDAAVGADAQAFKNGLETNSNPDVKNKSNVLIIPGEGHCTNSNQYKDFIVNNIDSWF